MDKFINTHYKNSKILFLKIFFYILIFLVFLNFTLYAETVKTIVTTIYPYYLLTKTIVKNNFKVVLFIPPNASPHTYSPLPSDIVVLNNANLIIANGLSLEENLKSKLKGYKDKVIYCSTFLYNKNLLSIKEKNPHIWLDPIFLIEIAKGITNKIIQIDPENKNFYLKNLGEVIHNLKDIYNSISISREKIKNDLYIITFHNSFYYFARRFNITIAGIIEPSAGKEPGLKELVKLGKIIKKYSIRAIFSEPQLNPKPVNILAKEYNLKIYTLDPIGYSLKINEIYKLYLKNWETILKSLK